MRDKQFHRSQGKPDPLLNADTGTWAANGETWRARRKANKLAFDSFTGEQLALPALEYGPREQRDLLRVLLIDSGRPDLALKLQRCQEPLKLMCIHCGEGRQVETGCRKRWCPVCVRKIAAAKLARYSYAAQRMQWPLMVTLTIRSGGYAKERLRDLVKAFANFRRSDWWKACDIKGGIYGIEITWATGGWHPHIHLLIDCRWLAIDAKEPRGRDRHLYMEAACKAAQKELAHEWGRHINRYDRRKAAKAEIAKLTGTEDEIKNARRSIMRRLKSEDKLNGVQDNACVWVDRVNARELTEVIKYSVKPAELINMHYRVVECIMAMDKTRMTQTFGSCQGLVKEQKLLDAVDKPMCKCEKCLQSAWITERAIKWGRGPVGRGAVNYAGHAKFWEREIAEGRMQPNTKPLTIRERMALQQQAEYQSAMAKAAHTLDSVSQSVI